MGNGRWYLLAGSTGAGKSTFARELVQRTGGVRFSIDEWMSNLFWMDCPEKNDLAFALDRMARCEEQIAAVARQLSGAGVDAILDLGFTQRSQREVWLQRALNAGIAIDLHVLNLPAEVRWQRVCERNAGSSETFSFAVTREMFDFMEARWEQPNATELAAFRQLNA
jgi:predicted kinase